MRSWLIRLAHSVLATRLSVFKSLQHAGCRIIPGNNIRSFPDFQNVLLVATAALSLVEIIGFQSSNGVGKPEDLQLQISTIRSNSQRATRSHTTFKGRSAATNGHIKRSELEFS